MVHQSFRVWMSTGDKVMVEESPDWIERAAGMVHDGDPIWLPTGDVLLPGHVVLIEKVGPGNRPKQVSERGV